MDAQITGAWRSPGTIEIFVGGAWKRVTRTDQYNAGSWKAGEVFTSPLSASANPTIVSDSSPIMPLITGSILVTPSGGLAPYTYSWSKILGVGTVSSPTSAATVFTHSFMAPDTDGGEFRCTVTDALGNTAAVDVTAYFTRE
jgi:hypothetical protein